MSQIHLSFLTRLIPTKSQRLSPKCHLPRILPQQHMSRAILTSGKSDWVNRPAERHRWIITYSHPVAILQSYLGVTIGVSLEAPKKGLSLSRNSLDVSWRGSSHTDPQKGVAGCIVVIIIMGT